NPPLAFAEGLIVNADGRRYINEFMYGAAIGEAMAEHNNGVAWVIIDQELRTLAMKQARPSQAQWVQWGPAWINLLCNSRKADNLEALAGRLRLPVENLRATVNAYNEAAAGITADALGKDRDHMHVMSRGPYYALDCSLNSRKFPCPTLTLGGLAVE